MLKQACLPADRFSMIELEGRKMYEEELKELKSYQQRILNLRGYL
jgi:hypothetical protein